MKSILLVCLAMSAALVHAQETDAPKPQDVVATPQDTTTKPNPFVLDKAVTLARCEQPALLKCIEMDVETCKTAMSESTDDANAAMAAEVAKAGPDVAKLEGFIQGFGAGKLMGGMIRRTKGKLYTCMSKR